MDGRGKEEQMDGTMDGKAGRQSTGCVNVVVSVLDFKPGGRELKSLPGQKYVREYFCSICVPNNSAIICTLTGEKIR